LRQVAWAVSLLALGYGVAEWFSSAPRFDLRQIEFARAVREVGDMPVVEIFFATNRQADSCGTHFSGEAAMTLSYGVAEVRIPERFRLTDVQRPEIPRGESASVSASILSVRPLAAAEFHRLLHDSMSRTGSAQATLFVHGIQNSFDSALRQAGALAFGLNLRQPMVLFSWTTDPGLSPSAYAQCRMQVPAAAQALKDFLRFEGPGDFDILAHSLGCKVVCQALAEAGAGDSCAKTGDSLANVILVAPDVDKDDFESVVLSPGMASSHHTTVYVARNDSALVLSSFLNGSPRAGAGISPSTHVEALFNDQGGDASRVEIIDATFVNTARTSHGYFYQNRAALADLQNLLRNDLPACQRQLLRHEKARHGNYWIIPP
jgi:esterase/lipase superfamily enzyme